MSVRGGLIPEEADLEHFTSPEQSVPESSQRWQQIQTKIQIQQIQNTNTNTNTNVCHKILIGVIIWPNAISQSIEHNIV